MNVRHVAADVTGLSDDSRTVHTTLGDVTNDALVIASGGRFIKKLPGIEYAITPCEGISAAEKIRDRLLAMTGGTIAIGFAGNLRSGVGGRRNDPIVGPKALELAK